MNDDSYFFGFLGGAAFICVIEAVPKAEVPKL
jgi:hypothetical protein